MEPADQAQRPAFRATELIFENGNPRGARRALHFPATLVGRAAGCDIRLKGGGVESAHCLLVHGRDGLQVRDLQTAAGTFVNGSRVVEALLQDGDALKIGGYLFRLHLAADETPCASSEVSSTGLRTQAAAVAAQQVALGEEEARLRLRLEALAQQEVQLSAHLEEKRRRLVQLGERAQHERAALESERAAYEQHVKQIGGNVDDAQRELLQKRQQLQDERRHLGVLRGRLRQRWQRQFAHEQRRLELRAEELVTEDSNLKQEALAIKEERQALTRERLTFDSQNELSRRQLQDARTRLHQERQEWRRRRSQEHAALGLRARELDEQRLSLSQAEEILRKQTEAFQTRRQGLERELDGLTQRLRNQRDKILEQQLEINRLDAVLRERRGQTAPEGSAAALVNTDTTATPLAPTADNAVSRRLVDLDRLADALGDQRRQLAEQWQRLAESQHRWEQDRARAAAELEAMVLPLQEQESALTQRDKVCRAAEEEMCKKHRELVQMRQHLVGWRARLRACETSWEGERQQLLSEIQHREKRAQAHLQALAGMRRRWSDQRRRELEKLQAAQAACDTLRQEFTRLRHDWLERYTAVDAEKRIWTERALALEQLRQEAFKRSGDAAVAQRRVERLRRRWLLRNVTSLRSLSQERRALKNELDDLEVRHADLRQRTDELRAAEACLSEKHTEWEQLHEENAARFSEVQRDLNIALSQRQSAQQQLEKLKEEIEQIARTLLEEPELPCASVAA
jgi:pSer/pThr/pTyr-binding forkhead associated (FHA) protein